jgi:hypothetical protein
VGLLPDLKKSLAVAQLNKVAIDKCLPYWDAIIQKSSTRIFSLQCQSFRFMLGNIDNFLDKTEKAVVQAWSFDCFACHLS